MSDDCDPILGWAETVLRLRAQLAAAQAENAALTTRRDELLALVARLSQTVPLESEVAEALGQRGALLAEVGTLRSGLDGLRVELEQANRVIEDRERGLRQRNAQLAAVTKERDEARDERDRARQELFEARVDAGAWRGK